MWSPSVFDDEDPGVEQGILHLGDGVVLGLATPVDGLTADTDMLALVVTVGLDAPPVLGRCSFGVDVKPFADHARHVRVILPEIAHPNDQVDCPLADVFQVAEVDPFARFGKALE